MRKTTPHLKTGTRIKAREAIGTVPKGSTGVVLDDKDNNLVNWYRPNGEGFIGKLALNRSDYSKVEVLTDAD